MEMLKRNLNRQASRSLSTFAVASPRGGGGGAAAADQENLHPNLAAASPPMSPVAKSSSAPGASPRSKPVPSSAAKAAAAEEERDSAPVDDAPAVKVVVRVRPAVSLPTDGKDLFFVRKTSPSSVAVGDRSFAVDGFLDDRASQADAFDLVGMPMIESALAGFNSSLVCYGQREESSPEKQTSYQCRCSFLEVHNEQINDLLDPSQRNLQGLSNRKVGTTSMNLKSSRSHVIFTCVIEAWSKGFSSNGFSSSRTSRITFVDLAGPDNDELDGGSRHCTREERYDTLGGNSRVTFLCSISSEHRCRSGTLSTLRFGERAKLMPNKAVINEISEDDVNGLSDQIRQLKDELIRTKSGDAGACKNGYFSAKNARESLHNLRVSLNRSLILPHIEVDPEEEMDVDEEDVQELRDQIRKLHSSSEDTFEDFMDAESGDDDTPCSKGNPKTSEEDDQPVMDDCEGLIQEEHEVSSTKADHDQASDQQSFLSISASPHLSPMQDPTLCSSPKIHNKARKSITSPGLSPSKLRVSDCPSDSNVEVSRKSAVRSSLQSSKLSPTDSLAASLKRGLHIMEYHEQNAAPRKSFVGLSFDHFALNPRQSVAKVSSGVPASPERKGATSALCSSCKKVIDNDGNPKDKINTEKQIVIATSAISSESASASVKDDNTTLTIASKREAELEALCEEQAAKIKELSNLVDQYKKGSEDAQTSGGIKPIKLADEANVDEEHANDREKLLSEIQKLRDQLKRQADESANDSLLEQIRNGSTDQEYELDKERQKWMESESKWISLTEELRVDLESNRMLAEKTEMELSNEKKCTEELDDALQRAIYGHARIIEHYAELQEMYNDLLERHRRVMEGISEVKRAAAKAGRKGCGTAFAAALAAELSTVRIDREKERAQLKEQNRRLRIQLRDTAEAVHAAGELLVRLREAEEASTQEKERSAALQQENDKLKKQLEKIKKKHEVEIETMKHFLADSRLPESALGGFYRQESEDVPEYNHGTQACDDDQSWRAAFTSAYE
uniref:Kinesin motor domain-containing protein n=1 Tax=Leersia perrieri TaxID=77586 RepID=A0A0D9VVZ6_9ORYZ